MADDGEKRIYHHGERYTRVVFGEGRIQVGCSRLDDTGFVQVHLNDSLKDHEISIAVEGWEEETNGQCVILDFNNIKSIEVLEYALKDAKACLTIRRAKRDGV